MNNQYSADSIQKMDPLTFCRHRPDTYLGSNENSTQLVREIVSNCSDEFLIGNCSQVIINYDKKNNIIKVIDDGQGILPNNWQGNKTTLEMVYGEINTSGKYDKSQDAIYKISTGAFGIGASLTNFLSHWLVATTYRNEEWEKVYFKEGVFQKRETGKCDKGKHGVEVSFQPSEEFFRDAKPDINQLTQELFNLACVCKGLKFILNDKIIYHPEGILDIVNHYINDDFLLTDNIFSFTNQINDHQIFDFCMAVTNKTNSVIIPFCNYGLIESGTPVTCVKSVLTRVLNKWGKEKGLITGQNLSGSILQEGLVLAFNLVSQNVRYDSQTKVRATHTEDNNFISSMLSQELEIWLDNNPKDAEAIIEKALVARKAAEAAKKARAAVKAKATTKTKLKIAAMPSKLADCHNKDRSKCELYLTEGDSASGGCKIIRDASFQAILGLKGKVLNCLTSDIKKIQKNAEIVDIIKALGLQWGVDNSVIYDEDKLRYDKLIIAADRDVDGAHIQSLICTMLWVLIPDIILDGHVYIALPPLYKAEWNKQYKYLDDKKALEDFKKDHKDFTLTYFKGLGEASPEELGGMIMNPKTRNIQQITVEDMGLAEKIINNLMGSDTQAKKEFVFGNKIKEIM